MSSPQRWGRGPLQATILLSALTECKWNGDEITRKLKKKKNAPPFSRQSGWVFQFLRDPWVAHTGGRKIFTPSPLLCNSSAFGKELQQKSVLLDISSAQYSRLTNANKFRLNTSLTSKRLSVTYLFLSWSLEAAVFKSNILKWTKKVFFQTKKVLSWSSTTLSNKTKFL